MSGISDLKILLSLMRPKLEQGEFVFCTISETTFTKLNIKPIMMFEEDEGITIIIRRSIADMKSIAYSGIWSWIKLQIHSDLLAIGFLAAITNIFAKSAVSINVVSAYYHDHLFVPKEKATQAMLLLKELADKQQLDVQINE